MSDEVMLVFEIITMPLHSPAATLPLFPLQVVLVNFAKRAALSRACTLGGPIASNPAMCWTASCWRIKRRCTIVERRGVFVFAVESSLCRNLDRHPTLMRHYEILCALLGCHRNQKLTANSWLIDDTSQTFFSPPSIHVTYVFCARSTWHVWSQKTGITQITMLHMQVSRWCSCHLT
jgi:hypothetical protein